MPTARYIVLLRFGRATTHDYEGASVCQVVRALPGNPLPTLCLLTIGTATNNITSVHVRWI